LGPVPPGRDVSTIRPNPGKLRAIAMSTPRPPDPFLRIIALFKLAKAALFFCGAVGLLHLLNKDVEAKMLQLIDGLHVDPDSHIPKWCLEQAGKLTNTKLVTFSAIGFFYSALFATEGTGLYLRKRWAEYFVVIVTASLLPFEAYEIWHRITVTKVLLTIANLIILSYLIYVIRRNSKR
jgi:uncharacterized membrane protein (DUF2068 family)